MGLLKIISSLFHGTEKSSELFEAEIPVAQENTSHDLMAGHVEDKMEPVTELSRVGRKVTFRLREYQVHLPVGTVSHEPSFRRAISTFEPAALIRRILR